MSADLKLGVAILALDSSDEGSSARTRTRVSRVSSSDSHGATAGTSASSTDHGAQDPVHASKTQMGKFMSMFGGNARQIQPLNSRTVGEF